MEGSQRSSSTLKAEAPAFTPSWINIGNDAQNAEAMPGHGETLAPDVACDANMKPWLCSIDVECIATGRTSADRAVARVALVDGDENVLMDALVRPKEKIVSYLTPLTGLEPGSLDDAPSLEEVRAELIKLLPKNAVIVGQAIQHDLDWLRLEEGTHFASSFDIGQLFRMERGPGRFRYFSLRHEVLHLEGFKGAGVDMQAGAHDPTLDAIYSVRIYQRFADAPEEDLLRARAKLSRVPATHPIWRKTPMIDNVQVGPPWIYK
ncbi:PAB-dependent polyA-specific ribonuclease subunit PAN2 [Hondaea fermentalgiana]|uniref:PAB-dependent polyA-specific ribonuclease subunit PAN2 n=1 Tax=Hondaea fermentalgiana TaxID=2315210 RepID=A0A2R5G378_9STRA|nr:PAB-dependent polyA-specific ribonuclease subunit PAN2 [Hondaea fermentalgiana]|eukprot:GBG25487.1 PAB-dependent polyA-specific ribonuclease subunit PAN2 [Hondaea fermentalgiana]